MALPKSSSSVPAHDPLPPQCPRPHPGHVIHSRALPLEIPSPPFTVTAPPSTFSVSRQPEPSPLPIPPAFSPGHIPVGLEPLRLWRERRLRVPRGRGAARALPSPGSPEPGLERLRAGCGRAERVWVRENPGGPGEWGRGRQRGSPSPPPCCVHRATGLSVGSGGTGARQEGPGGRGGAFKVVPWGWEQGGPRVCVGLKAVPRGSDEVALGSGWGWWGQGFQAGCLG